MCDIAAVVLNYINYKDTMKCVDNLLSNSTALAVIVDNSSPNESVDLLKEHFHGRESRCIILINDKNSGYASGNNVGLRYIAKFHPEIKNVCIMNPDTLFDDPQLLDVLQIAMSKKKSYAVISPVMIQHGTEDFKHTCWNFPNGIELAFNQLMFYHPKRRNCDKKKNIDGLLEVDIVHGSFFMIKMEALKEIGFLDEHTFMYSEECLLAHDLKKVGYQEAVLLDCFYYHNHPANIKRRNITLRERLNKSIRGSMRSRIYICKKHYGRRYIPLIYLTSGLNIIYLCLLHVLYKMKTFLD